LETIETYIPRQVTHCLIASIKDNDQLKKMFRAKY